MMDHPQEEQVSVPPSSQDDDDLGGPAIEAEQHAAGHQTAEEEVDPSSSMMMMPMDDGETSPPTLPHHHYHDTTASTDAPPGVAPPPPPQDEEESSQQFHQSPHEEAEAAAENETSHHHSYQDDDLLQLVDATVTQTLIAGAETNQNENENTEPGEEGGTFGNNHGSNSNKHPREEVQVEGEASAVTGEEGMSVEYPQQPHHYQQQQQEALVRAESQVAGAAAMSREEEEPAPKRARLEQEQPQVVAASAGGGLGTGTGAAKAKVHAEQWESMFLSLQEFREQHGHLLVPKRHGKLGTWVETQRVQYKRLQISAETGLPIPNKRLTAERLEKLTSIGFVWSAKGMPKLQQNPTVSASASTAAVSKRAAPVVQRTPAGESSSTRSEGTSASKSATATSQATTASTAIALPKSPPPAASSSSWSSTPGKKRAQQADANWNDMYVRLQQFQQQHGHAVVPRKYPEDPKLATWVETQRIVWNRQQKQKQQQAAAQAADQLQSSLQQQQVAQVTGGDSVDPAAVSLVVDPKNSSENNNGISAALAHNNPKPNTSPSARLSDDRKAKLDALGFVWSLRSKRIDDHWDGMFQQLLDYKHQHGDCLVPSRYSNVKLGKWVETQRYEYTKLMRTVQQHQQQQQQQQAETDRALDGTVAATSDMNTAAAPPPLPQPSSTRLTPERLAKLQAIGFEWKVKHKMKRYYDKQWDAMYDRLVAFQEQMGHCLVPKRYPPDLKLGTWVHTQRIQYRKLMAGTAGKQGSTATSASDTGPSTAAQPVTEAEMTEMKANMKGQEEVSYRLTEERKQRLEAIGFCWSAKEAAAASSANKSGVIGVSAAGLLNHHHDTASTFDATTQAAEAAASALTVNGLNQQAQVDLDTDSLPTSGNQTTSTSPSPDPSKLNQNGSSSSRQRLSRNSYDDQWDQMFQRLAAFKQLHGHALVPKRYQEDPKLGTWVDTQRVQFKKLKKKLAEQGKDYVPPSARATVDESGTISPVDPSTFASAGGASSTPTASSSSSKPLVGRLTDDRIQRLESLGFVWSLRDDWQKHYDELKEYKSLHGHCNVPARYPQNRRLGIWVSAQRQQFKILQQQHVSAQQAQDPVVATAKQRRSAPLTQERIQLLNELGFVWTIRSRDSVGESWAQRLEELRIFKNQYGHCNVPSRFPDNPELGVWVGTQRTQYKAFMKSKETGTVSQAAGAMNDDRIRLLEELEFNWTIRGVSAQTGLALAMDYAEQHLQEEPSQHYPHYSPVDAPPHPYPPHEHAQDQDQSMLYYDHAPTVGHHDEIITAQEQHDAHHAAELAQQSVDEAVLAMQQAAQHVANTDDYAEQVEI